MFGRDQSSEEYQKVFQFALHKILLHCYNNCDDSLKVSLKDKMAQEITSFNPTQVESLIKYLKHGGYITNYNKHEQYRTHEPDEITHEFTLGFRSIDLIERL